MRKSASTTLSSRAGGVSWDVFAGAGGQQLHARIPDDRLRLPLRGLIPLGNDDALPRGVLMHRLLHGGAPLGDLKPAFAGAIETIDPVLAVGRFAWLAQALLFRVSGRGGVSGSGRGGCSGSGVEQGGEGI